jgi:hypothetical protein
MPTVASSANISTSALLVGVSDQLEKKPLHMAFASMAVILLCCEDVRTKRE